MIEISRVYGRKGGQGFRILIDRVWPRGLKKEDVRADLWLRDIAPSSDLRRWFGHDPQKWREFRRRYFQELDGKQDQVALIRSHERDGKVVLLYGAREERYNNAVALKEYLESRAKAA